MNSVPTDPLIGITLDERYVIRSRIARGGMAMVYLANDLRLERRVAVKVMHSHLAEDSNFTRRFEQEARSAAGLSHPNLVGVFDQGHDAGHTYLVMEYLPSITLRALLKQQKALTEEQALEIGEAVLSGLAAAHTAGIVHRDLKPENVMLADDGRIKLGDFGLARAVSANTTTGQALLGTIAYLSPELVTRGVADARSDIYAFGIMLYEMLTGEQPFTGEQPMQIAYQHANSDVPAPSLKSPDTSPELDELVVWATQRDPEKRPRDAMEAIDYLQRVRKGLPVPAPEHSTTVLDEVTGEHTTPSTAVLEPMQQALLVDEGDAAQSDSPSRSTPLDRAAGAAATRRARGRVWAVIILLLIAAAGGIGWWFGQGPGSQVTVPDVQGLEVAAASDLITEQDLLVEVFECTSLETAEGLVDRTDPKAGSRVDRETTVQICRSLGPEMLPVPTLVGIDAEKAEAAIVDARFTFGKVLEQRFTDEDAGTVIAALDTDGEGLGEEYPEQATIDLIVSAGPIPNVTGKSVDEATSQLSDVDLRVDDSMNSESYHDEVPAGDVIEVLHEDGPVRPGDSVGLRTSLGPELFEIPSVSGMPLQDAIDTLREHGFEATTSVPETLQPLAEATTTNPEAGTMVQKGTSVQIRATARLDYD